MQKQAATRDLACEGARFTDEPLGKSPPRSVIAVIVANCRARPAWSAAVVSASGGPAAPLEGLTA